MVLGPATYDQIEDVLGVAPHTTPTPDVPAGRGYARLGAGAVHRLQVPATPDPYDDATSEADRQAVLALLPQRTTPDGDSPEAEPVVEAAEPVDVVEAVEAVGTVRTVAAEG